MDPEAAENVEVILEKLQNHPQNRTMFFKAELLLQIEDQKGAQQPPSPAAAGRAQSPPGRGGAREEDEEEEPAAARRQAAPKAAAKKATKLMSRSTGALPPIRSPGGSGRAKARPTVPALYNRLQKGSGTMWSSALPVDNHAVADQVSGAVAASPLQQ